MLRTNTRKRNAPVLALLLLAASTVGCAGGGTAPSGPARNAIPPPNPAASVASISPSSIAAGGTDLTLTVTGSSFVSGAMVVWNGVDLATTYVSGSQLTSIVPAARLATPGTVPVQVSNPPPGGGLSGAVMFSIQNGVPTLSSLSPASVLAASESFTMTVDGTNFAADSSVLWDSNPLTTTFLNSGRLLAEVPASRVTVAGNRQVAVLNPAAGGGTSPDAQFSVTAAVPRFAYALESSRGVITIFTVDETTGKLTESGSQVAANPLDGPHGILLTRSRRFLYTSSYGTGEIRGFEINLTDGSLNPIAGPVANCGPGSEWFAEHPSGRFLYVANDDTGHLCAYAVAGQTGVLTSIVGSPYSAGSNPTQLAMDPGGKFLFVPDSGTDSIHGFTIDAASGVLTQISGSPFAASGVAPWAVVVDPSGRCLVVSNFDSVSLYQIDGVTGTLTNMPGSPFMMGSYPLHATFDLTGRFLYIAENNDSYDGHIYAFSLDSGTGALSAVLGSPFSLGNGLGVDSVTLNNALTFAYFLNYLPGYLSTFTVDSVTGSLTLMDTMPLRPDVYKLTLLELPPST